MGFRYLSRLLAHPDRELTAAELGGALGGAAVLDGRQELLDATAVGAYRRRIRELVDAIDEADAHADLARAERLRLEREAVASELARAVGLGGRLRGFSSSPERARTAVRKALKRAIDALAAADPVLGAELRAAIATGAACRYTPRDRLWRVDQV